MALAIYFPSKWIRLETKPLGSEFKMELINSFSYLWLARQIIPVKK
jgi:hypothetical protein